MLLVNKKTKTDATVKAIFTGDPKLKNLFISTSKVGSVSIIDSEKTIYVYLGDKNKCSFQKIYDALRLYLTDTKFNLTIDCDSFKFNDKDDSWIKAVVEGVIFGHHNKYTLKTKQKPRVVEFDLVSNEKNIQEIFDKSQALISSINIARDLQDAPPNVIYAQTFVDEVKEKFKDLKNIKISTLDLKEINELGMNLFLSVNAGSVYPGKILVIEYLNNPNSKEKIAFVGKGITMDTGGYALKPLPGQMNERYDMCGGASVIAAMYGISKLAPKKNIMAVCPLTDNRIGGATTLNTAIVKSMNGLTVQITSTDAEGRMVMADSMTYAIRKKQATKLITLATLTGAMIQGLGKYVTGAMSTNDQFFDNVFQASKRANERLWRMPLDDENYAAMQDTQYADLVNHTYSKYNPPGNAAAFLDCFAEEKPFVHIDIAGTAYIDDRSKGTMIKTLIELALMEEG